MKTTLAIGAIIDRHLGNNLYCEEIRIHPTALLEVMHEHGLKEKSLLVTLYGIPTVEDVRVEYPAEVIVHENPHP